MRDKGRGSGFRCVDSVAVAEQPAAERMAGAMGRQGQGHGGGGGGLVSRGLDCCIFCCTPTSLSHAWQVRWESQVTLSMNFCPSLPAVLSETHIVLPVLSPTLRQA